MQIWDIFGGGGGSHAQGDPNTAGGATNGDKTNTINRWLSAITGVYSTVTGVGRPAGPAPAPAAQTAAATKTNWAMYAGLAVAAAVVFWLLFKRK